MEKIKVCYVVKCSAGQYEDSTWWIAGIFDNPFDAENLKREIDKSVEITRNTIDPLIHFSNAELWTPEQESEYDRWFSDFTSAENFNYSVVEEYPFGKPVSPKE